MPDSSRSVDTAEQADSRKFSIRCDPVHGWPVIYAPPRALRPCDFRQTEPQLHSENDPFAEGHEDITTPEVLAFRDPGSPANGPGWKVRIIPNKFPVLAPVPEHCQSEFNTSFSTASAELYPCGIHEVIIECPEHETHFTRLSEPQRDLIFQAMHQRLAELSQQKGLAHATIFKNHGRGAGASLAHAHSQLIVTPFVNPHIRRELDHCRNYKPAGTSTEVDYFEDLITRERSADVRVVEETSRLIVICPEASRFALEMQILVKQPEPHFHLCCAATLHELNQVLTRSLQRLEKLVGSLDYNLVLHTAPFHEENLTSFRWHWEIYPRLSGIAGLELGMGGYVNAVYPEQAARMLRQAEVTTQ